MREWIQYFYFDNNKLGGVFPCVLRTYDDVIVLFNENEYDIPIENTRVIDPPNMIMEI